MIESSYEIAALPGDGIGPEVLEATLEVLHAATARAGLELRVKSLEAGAAHYRDHGVALPPEVLEACLSADAVLLAAIGLPEVRKSDGTEVQPDMMMGLRRAMGLHSAVRPCRLFPGVRSPLADPGPGIDLVVVRENLEGLFASFGGGCVLEGQVATDTIVITHEGTRRVVDYAFRLASRRAGRPLDGRRSVTCVDKANVFRSFAFFRKVFFEVAAEHPEIVAEAAYVDAMSLYLVQRPSAYDVLVMENQFGDILSDLGAGIVGGLGMAPSAEIGDRLALFQPSHGSAPDIAGKSIANPIATVLSAAMMLDWLAVTRKDPRARDACDRIEDAVARVLAEGSTLTVDLGGRASTSEVGTAIAERIRSRKSSGEER